MSNQGTCTPTEDRVLELLAAAADGWLTEEEREELLSLLRNDPLARAVYAEHAMLQSFLHHKARSRKGAGFGVQDSGMLPAFPAITPLPTNHYPLTTTFVGGPVFSYMVATVVLCLMLLGAWAYKISHINDPHIVDNNRRSTTSGPEALVFVGKITGLKACRWSDTGDPTLLGALVSLDREYALASGLMEITYQSGARVILEGPCTYRVDSNAGGFLERGKLTARIDSAKPQAANHSSPIPHPSSLFAVRTPTALITDLGTEFGVSVNERDGTEVHVFDGVVEIEHKFGESTVEKRRLEAGEAVRIDAVDRTAPIADARFDRDAFPTFENNAEQLGDLPPLPVTHDLALWLAADVGVVCDDESGVEVWRDLLVGDNRRSENARQPSREQRPRLIADAIAGKPAVRFDGATSHLVTEPLRSTGEQTVFVVFALPEGSVAPSPTTNSRQLFNGNGPPSLVLETVENDTFQARVYVGCVLDSDKGTHVGIIAHPKPSPGRPSLMDYTYSPQVNKATLRIDGRRVGDAKAPAPVVVLSRKWIGCHPTGHSHFAGDIAEMIIYDSALTADEIARVESYLGEKYQISTKATSAE